MIDEMALLICPKTQTNIEIKAPTIPTAAKLSVAFTSILPIIAVSVIDNKGSAIPAIKAGMASLLMFLKRNEEFNPKKLTTNIHICKKIKA